MQKNSRRSLAMLCRIGFSASRSGLFEFWVRIAKGSHPFRSSRSRTISTCCVTLVHYREGNDYLCRRQSYTESRWFVGSETDLKPRKEAPVCSQWAMRKSRWPGHTAPSLTHAYSSSPTRNNMPLGCCVHGRPFMSPFPPTTPRLPTIHPSILPSFHPAFLPSHPEPRDEARYPSQCHAPFPRSSSPFNSLS